MTLAAVMPILTPSIWFLSWPAISSQRSASAGEATNAASSASVANMAWRNWFLVMNTPAPLKLARKIHASAQPRPGSDRGGSVANSKDGPKTALFALALVRQRNSGLPAGAIIEEGLAVAAADHQFSSGDLRAEPRLDRADTRQVKPAAGSGVVFGEQAGVAWLPDKAAAGLADPDRAGGGGDHGHQRQRGDKRKNKSRFHGCLPFGRGKS